MGKETLTTIAERLGISVTTVSRVIGGKADKYRISPETVLKVREEAKRCNYLPSIIAQSLRTNKTGTIGLVVPSVANPFFADIASVIIPESHRRGRTTIVIDSMEDEKYQNESIRNLVARKVDGIIVAPCGDDASLLEMVNREHVPVVLIDRFFEDTTLSYVTTNSYQGGLDATRYLIKNGHTDIACVQGVTLSTPNKRRVKGYMDAMKESGLEDRILVVGNEFSIQNGFLETKLLLNRTPRPSAIFALSNTIVLGVIKAVREAGLRIPEDISIISFDNNIYLDYMVPPVTRISQPVEDMAMLAAKLLFEKMDGRQDVLSNTHLALVPSFIPGASVSKI